MQVPWKPYYHLHGIKEVLCQMHEGKDRILSLKGGLASMIQSIEQRRQHLKKLPIHTDAYQDGHQ